MHSVHADDRVLVGVSPSWENFGGDGYCSCGCVCFCSHWFSSGGGFHVPFNASSFRSIQSEAEEDRSCWCGQPVKLSIGIPRRGIAPAGLAASPVLLPSSKFSRVIDWPISAHSLPRGGFGRSRHFSSCETFASRLRSRQRVISCRLTPRVRRYISSRCAASSR